MTLYLLGNVVIDLVLTVPALPDRGDDVIATSATYATGGGFNVMVAASRLGLPTVYGGVLGTGPHASRAVAALAAAGVAVARAARAEGDTGLVVAMVDDGGERTFVTSVGAEATLTAEQLADVRPVAGDAVCVSGYSLLPSRAPSALATWVADLDAEVLVVVDPGPLVARITRDVLDVVLGRCDWWTSNVREATVVTGAVSAPDAAARLATSIGRRGVVVRDGASGCWLVDKAVASGPLHVPGFTVDALDLNGAGDAHTGAFMAALASGLTARSAARRANAAAALAVTRRGPATGPTRAELDVFLAGHDR